MFRCRQSRFPQGRAWLGALTAMTASVALFGAGSASAADVLDAHCGDPTAATSTSSSSIPRVGQTFTALNTGQLTSATLSVNKGSNNDAFSMQIRPLDMSGVPDESAASAIATESVPAPASSGFVPLIANFSSPASVVAGQQYALVVERTADVFGVGTAAVPCAGDIWVTNPGPVWGLGPTADLAFAIRVNAVEPPPTQPPPTQPNTTAPTGQRAAALKKCKKKFPGKAKAEKRKKCIKKARKLPV
jgi:hypothetical protein